MAFPAEAQVPEHRIRLINRLPPSTSGSYVLYWMTSARRTTWNFGLDRAIELARETKRPLVVLEALRSDYPWASARFHRFAIDGMVDNAAAWAGKNVLYYPYVEPQSGAGSGLLECLAKHASAVVTDDSPAFFLQRMLRAATGRVKVRFEAVDSNGILPMRTPGRRFGRAYDFRRYLQRELAPHLLVAPHRDPLLHELAAPGRVPEEVEKRWPAADLQHLKNGGLAEIALDHSIQPSHIKGGSAAAGKCMHDFLDQRLHAYGQERNQPESDGSSGLSPYLHFGHVAAHEVLHSLADKESWSPFDMTEMRSGKRTGWWSMSEPAEAFLDQIVTWRELGFNAACNTEDPTSLDRLECLPDWAQKTLAEHADDPRPYIYTLGQFESASTHDDLWNAAQNQLRFEGRMHNYLRMLWGKKILHWSRSPEEALAIMIELNNKYALDGRDPNSTSGILWVLGLYDRAWGPERPIFGKIRFMSEENTRRKLRVGSYIERWSGGQSALDF